MTLAQRLFAASLLVLTTVAPVSSADDGAKNNPLAGLPMRHIGPALMSGRISDFAFYPESNQTFIAGISSGNVFRTTNGGTTWEPIFDNEDAYAIGVVELDPNDSDTIWVGTGENNAQRSVAAGTGVYKSVNGGQSWENMGLRDSGHISQIWINPNDSDEVLVASQGPLWSDGGERGLYRTTDGGTTWDLILDIDEHTGVNEFVVDPRNPNVIVASSYQRRRHVWVLINGGPGSGIYKSTDRGESWSEVKAGLPSDDMGRIGLAGAASDPDMLYA
ncbi:glycosyl hydrolase, partial [Luminiphilus sp.]|nr:glycosyl hydrolase [Luminiphilus sp.]